MEFKTLPCRTCGKHFSIGQDMDQLKPIIAMEEILMLLTEWKVKVAPEDGLPQYMCYVCIADFQKVLKLKSSSLETQEKFVHMKSLELYVAPVYKSSGIQRVPIAAEHMALLVEARFQTAEPEKRLRPIGSSLDMMQNDSLTIPEAKDWECHICAKHFRRNQESRFKFHMKWHKLERRLKCPMCRFFCRSKAILNDHKRAAHPLAKCNFCSKFIRRHLLHRHINKHMEKREPEMANKLSSLQQPSVRVSSVVSSPVSSSLIVACSALKAPSAAVAASTQNASPGPAVPRRYSLRVASANSGRFSPLEPSNKQVVPRKIYWCCDKSFGLKTELVQHLKRHTHPRI